MFTIGWKRWRQMGRVALICVLIIVQATGCNRATVDPKASANDVVQEQPQPQPPPQLNLAGFDKLVESLANQNPQPIQRDQFNSAEEFEQRFRKATGITWQVALALAARVEGDAQKAAQLKLPDTSRLESQLVELHNKRGSYLDDVQKQIGDAQSSFDSFKTSVTRCIESLKTLTEKSASIAKCIKEIDEELEKIKSASDPKAALDAWFATSVVKKLEAADIGNMNSYSAKFLKAYEQMRSEFDSLQMKLLELAKATNSPKLIDETVSLRKDVDDFSAKTMAFAGAAVQIIAAASSLGPWGTLAALVLLALVAIFSGQIGGGGGTSNSKGKGGQGTGNGNGNGQGAGNGNKNENEGSKGKEEGKDGGKGEDGQGGGAALPGPDGSKAIGGKSASGPHRWQPYVSGTKVIIVIAGYNTSVTDRHARVEFDSASDALRDANTALSSGAAALTIESDVASDGTFAYPLHFLIEHDGKKFGCSQSEKNGPVQIDRG